MPDAWSERIEQRLHEIEALVAKRVPLSDSSFVALKNLAAEVKVLQEVVEGIPLQLQQNRANVAELRESMFSQLGELALSLKRQERANVEAKASLEAHHERSREVVLEAVSELRNKVEHVVHSLRSGGGA